MTYTDTPTYASRADERRRRVRYYRIPEWNGEKSNYPFNNFLIAATAKSWLPALRRSIRSKYRQHVGAKQTEKLSHNQ